MDYCEVQIESFLQVGFQWYIMTIAYGGKRTITFLQAWTLSFVESRKKMHFTK